MNERLVTFIYEMIRHHAPAAVIEMLIEKVEVIAIDQEQPDPFEQTHIELFAREMAARLERDE